MSSITVDLFVMSKCPDGVYAQSAFHAIQQHPDLKVPLIVNLAFITNEKNECMHGRSECEGNKIELAVQSTLGGGKTHGVLDFTEAYGKEYSKIDTPNDYLEASFAAANITSAERETILTTYEQHGQDLLNDSAAYAKQKKARYSATIMIHGQDKVLAIRDSNTWKGLAAGLGDGSVDDWVKYFNTLKPGL